MGGFYYDPTENTNAINDRMLSRRLERAIPQSTNTVALKQFLRYRDRNHHDSSDISQGTLGELRRMSHDRLAAESANMSVAPRWLYNNFALRNQLLSSPQDFMGEVSSAISQSKAQQAHDHSHKPDISEGTDEVRTSVVENDDKDSLANAITSATSNIPAKARDINTMHETASIRASYAPVIGGVVSLLNQGVAHLRERRAYKHAKEIQTNEINSRLTFVNTLLKNPLVIALAVIFGIMMLGKAHHNA